MTYQIFECLVLTIVVGMFWRFGFVELIRQLYESKLTTYRSQLIDFALNDTNRVESHQYRFTMETINALIDKSSRVGLIKLLFYTKILSGLLGNDLQSYGKEVMAQNYSAMSSEECEYYTELHGKIDSLGRLYFALTNPITLLIVIVFVIVKLFFVLSILMLTRFKSEIKDSSTTTNGIEKENLFEKFSFKRSLFPITNHLCEGNSIILPTFKSNNRNNYFSNLLK